MFCEVSASQFPLILLSSVGISTTFFANLRAKDLSRNQIEYDKEVFISSVLRAGSENALANNERQTCYIHYLFYVLCRIHFLVFQFHEFYKVRCYLKSVMLGL